MLTFKIGGSFQIYPKNVKSLRQGLTTLTFLSLKYRGVVMDTVVFSRFRLLAATLFPKEQ